MDTQPLTAVDRSSSILDRASPIQSPKLTEAQALTDQLVSVSIQEGTNLKTAAAMLGAGWVGRATRIGAMASLPGQAVLPHALRGASYVPALAAESAAFAGIERGFHRLDGQKTTQPFQKDWARAVVTLTGLKAFGGISRGQNIVLQHLFTDLGLVGGHHAAHAAGLMDMPQGGFTEQMLQAEATNWHMKGSLAFAHALSPRLLATEQSLDIFLKPQENRFFSEGQASPFFPRFTEATEGVPASFRTISIPSEVPKGPEILSMSKRGEGAPKHSLVRQIADLFTENPPTLSLSPSEAETLAALPLPYRGTRRSVIQKIFAHLEGLRAGLERGSSGHRKFIEEYERSIELLPKNDPEVRKEIQKELEKIRSHFEPGRGLKKTAQLEVYGILIASLHEGDPLINAERGFLKTAITKGEPREYEWRGFEYNLPPENRVQMIAAYTRLIERYSDNDSRAAEDVAWLRDVYSNTGYSNWGHRVIREIQNAYVSAMKKLPVNQALDSYRRIRLLRHVDLLKLKEPGIRMDPPPPIDFYDRALKALESRLPQTARNELDSEPLPDAESGEAVNKLKETLDLWNP